jgi:hypothetical protein
VFTKAVMIFTVFTSRFWNRELLLAKSVDQVMALLVAGADKNHASESVDDVREEVTAFVSLLLFCRAVSS